MRKPSHWILYRIKIINYRAAAISRFPLKLAIKRSFVNIERLFYGSTIRINDIYRSQCTYLSSEFRIWFHDTLRLWSKPFSFASFAIKLLSFPHYLIMNTGENSSTRILWTGNISSKWVTGKQGSQTYTKAKQSKNENGPVCPNVTLLCETSWGAQQHGRENKWNSICDFYFDMNVCIFHVVTNIVWCCNARGLNFPTVWV